MISSLTYCFYFFYCYPVQGNVIMVRDRHHLTNTYSSTFGHYIFNDVFPYIKQAKAEKIAKKKAAQLAITSSN